MKLKLRAYFSEYNSNWGRLTLNFLDDEIEAFTHDFLINKHEKSILNGINSPVHNDTTKFYVKIKKKSFINSYTSESKIVRVPIQDLLEHIVIMEVDLKNYLFNGKAGWYLSLNAIYKETI